MATQEPKNIFELINLNVYNLSQDVAEMYRMIKEIHEALYPQPTSPGTEDK
jgi:hypothetical protein